MGGVEHWNKGHSVHKNNNLKKKLLLYSGAHSRVSTLIQPSFQKKKKKKKTTNCRNNTPVYRVPPLKVYLTKEKSKKKKVNATVSYRIAISSYVFKKSKQTFVSSCPIFLL